jgi:hypothetical protein
MDCMDGKFRLLGIFRLPRLFVLGVSGFLMLSFMTTTTLAQTNVGELENNSTPALIYDERTLTLMPLIANEVFTIAPRGLS